MENAKFLGVGSKFPHFSLDAVKEEILPEKFSLHELKGKWSVFFTWPFDFTFICPTELKGFNAHYEKFQKLNCNLVGMSIDSPFVHQEWVSSLNINLNFPILSDVKRELSNQLGIIENETGATYRVTYIIDPECIIRSVMVNDLTVGRSVEEVLRLVEAFQTEKLCACDWQPGDKTLN